MIGTRVRQRASPVLALLGVLLLAACGRAAEPDAATPLPPAGLETHEAANPARPPLPTIYPSATPQPAAAATATTPPLPTAAPKTPATFDETVVRVSYAIPALGLERTIEGNVAAHVTVTDETTGASATRQNQPGILLQLQQSLAALELADLPDECAGCVRFSYSLPLANLAGNGWLQDVQMLASVENFTSAVVGPHYPPGTAVGLRRSATPYYPAHTVAVAADGRLWRWSAVQPEVAAPDSGNAATAGVLASAEAINVAEIATTYAAACPAGAGIDSVRLGQGAAAADIRVVCAELALPAGLLPLFMALQALGEAVAAEAFLPMPEPIVPLAALIHYRRADGARLDLLSGDLAVAHDVAGVAYSQTITPTLVLSLTEALGDVSGFAEGSEQLQAGVPGNILFFRAPWAVRELAWEGDIPPRDAAAITSDLDRILDRMLAGAAQSEPTSESPGAPGPTPTPSGGG